MTLEKERAALQKEARVLFQTAIVLGKMFSQKQQQLEFMAEYDFLFTDADRRQAKIARLKANLEKGGKAK